MPRPKKKPDYDAESIMRSLFSAVSESYNSPAADEAVDGHKKLELVAEEFDITRLKVRKILITTGDYASPQTREAAELRRRGKKTSEIAEKMGLAVCTVTSLLPYERTTYNLEEISTAAERIKVYRERKSAVEALQGEPSSINLWRTIIAFQGYQFTTSGRGSKEGVKFKYTVSRGGPAGRQYAGESVDGWGNEIMIESREKSITRSSVDYALNLAATTTITGPKSLKVYGSSYVFAIFRRFGLV